MKQYCRYCQNMVCGDANYCSEKKRTFSNEYIKSTNHCKSFEFNPIDALFENKEGYKPRKQKKDDGEQIMFYPGGDPNGLYGVLKAKDLTEVDIEDLKQQFDVFKKYAGER